MIGEWLPKLFLHALEVLDQKGIKTITPDQSANIIAIPVTNPGEAEMMLKKKYGKNISKRYVW